MGFARRFSEEQRKKMMGGANAPLFERLKEDVLLGEVFPAVRVGALDFYYRGGRLFRFAGGAFRRDKNYEKYGDGLEPLSPYERAKKETERRFIRASGKEAERLLLDGLNRHTYDFHYAGEVVVLDIEVDLHADGEHGKKCDMVLLNRQTGELMFVEGKVFSDSRVLVKRGNVPEVIAQVQSYSAAVGAQRQAILEGYAAYAQIMNALFSVTLPPPKRVVERAKLLVYATPPAPSPNGEYSMQTICSALGKDSVLWIKEGEAPSLDEIWKSLIG